MPKQADGGKAWQRAFPLVFYSHNKRADAAEITPESRGPEAALILSVALVIS
jgi:hypothetical protein